MVVRGLIPEHKLLSDADAKKVSKEFDVPLDKFPKIRESDPQALRLEAKPGKLLLIDRKDGNNKYTAYRYVIKG